MWRTTPRTLLGVLTVFAGDGCRRQGPPPPQQPSAVSPAPVVTSAPTDSVRQTRPALPAPRTDTLGRPSSLAVVAGSSAWVGKRLRLTGWCIGPWIALAPGSAPRSKSDWVLTDDTTSLYVVGTVPHNCPVNGRSSAPVTIEVVVAEDTVPLVLQGPPTARRFLMTVDH